MKLIKLEIIEFGALHDYTLEFNDGLNIIEGQNESGKSTIMAFIRFMLYGFAGKSLGLKLEGAADLSRYADGGQVADWAQAQVAWAVENGIMTAINGKLEPNANAGRGDVAMMLMAFGKKYM